MVPLFTGLECALYLASSRGQTEEVRQLLADGGDVAAKDGFMEATPLHGAARGGHDQVSRMLIDANADVAATDRHLTPSHPHTLTPSHPHSLTPSHPHTLTPSQAGSNTSAPRCGRGDAVSS